MSKRMYEVYTQAYARPEEGHALSREATRAFEGTREAVAGLIKALDREGIAVRSGKLAAQPLLKALGVDEAVRASFLFYNTFAEADFLADTLQKLVA
jgi:selenocysteine lyase/cysteine desulfurase